MVTGVVDCSIQLLNAVRHLYSSRHNLVGTPILKDGCVGLISCSSHDSEAAVQNSLAWLAFAGATPVEVPLRLLLCCNVKRRRSWQPLIQT